MKKVQGDLLSMACEGQFDVIVHGCNCQCEMGAGIARAIKSLFPEAYPGLFMKCWDCQLHSHIS